jgi:hypothetical protein
MVILNRGIWLVNRPPKNLSELLCSAGEAVLKIDETGHKENGQKFWTRTASLGKIDFSAMST